MKKESKQIVALRMGVFLLGLGFLFKKRLPRMPIKQYTKACLYMAVLDDEICRDELEGNFIGGKEIVFPSKPDSLQCRYHLFLGMYRKYTKAQVYHEIDKLEKRLVDSREFCNKEKENLTLAFR
ncbi:hypothetical protein [Anaerotignum sp. MB30-C6]|uniref:hypothetical protein n=1 Tax=Anaerotignum sp. MB30-C6 TaxID=3070814 RepID=UPI0027DAF685|nr:hypothetical protein [Anaerotignum sp. MB30-C6]WMI81996.1 hypothetical protein RBQ60_04485 [Anaerotignum sp. MB30-C6]